MSAETMTARDTEPPVCDSRKTARTCSGLAIPSDNPVREANPARGNGQSGVMSNRAQPARSVVAEVDPGMAFGLALRRARVDQPVDLALAVAGFGEDLAGVLAERRRGVVDRQIALGEVVWE